MKVTLVAMVASCFSESVNSPLPVGSKGTFEVLRVRAGLSFLFRFDVLFCGVCLSVK